MILIKKSNALSKTFLMLRNNSCENNRGKALTICVYCGQVYFFGCNLLSFLPMQGSCSEVPPVATGSPF